MKAAKRMAAKVPVASCGMLAIAAPLEVAAAAEVEATLAAWELLEAVGVAVPIMVLIIAVPEVMLRLALEDPPPTAGSKADALSDPHCSLDLQLFNPAKLPALMFVHCAKVAKQM